MCVNLEIYFEGGCLLLECFDVSGSSRLDRSVLSQDFGYLGRSNLGGVQDEGRHGLGFQSISQERIIKGSNLEGLGGCERSERSLSVSVGQKDGTRRVRQKIADPVLKMSRHERSRRYASGFDEGVVEGGGRGGLGVSVEHTAESGRVPESVSGRSQLIEREDIIKGVVAGEEKIGLTLAGDKDGGIEKERMRVGHDKIRVERREQSEEGL